MKKTRKQRSDIGKKRGPRTPKVVKTNKEIQEKINEKYKDLESVNVFGQTFRKKVVNGIIRYV